MALIHDYLLIQRMCENVTPAMRRFSAQNFGTAHYLEEWVRGVNHEGNPADLQPFSAEFLWKRLLMSIPYIAQDGEPW